MQKLKRKYPALVWIVVVNATHKQTNHQFKLRVKNVETASSYWTENTGWCFLAVEPLYLVRIHWVTIYSVPTQQTSESHPSVVWSRSPRPSAKSPKVFPDFSYVGYSQMQHQRKNAGGSAGCSKIGIRAPTAHQSKSILDVVVLTNPHPLTDEQCNGAQVADSAFSSIFQCN